MNSLFEMMNSLSESPVDHSIEFGWSPPSGRREITYVRKHPKRVWRRGCRRAGILQPGYLLKETAWVFRLALTHGEALSLSSSRSSRRYWEAVRRVASRRLTEVQCLPAKSIKIKKSMNGFCSGFPGMRQITVRHLQQQSCMMVTPRRACVALFCSCCSTQHRPRSDGAHHACRWITTEPTASPPPPQRRDAFAVSAIAHPLPRQRSRSAGSRFRRDQHECRWEPLG